MEHKENMSHGLKSILSYLSHMSRVSETIINQEQKRTKKINENSKS